MAGKSSASKAKKAHIPITGMTCVTCAATSEYKGRKYYFCAAGCKKAFDQNPGKYLARKN